MSEPNSESKNLIYTIAFDPPNEPYHQMMAKMLVSSIFRTGFTGDVLVLTNSEHRVYEHGRRNLEEVCLDSTRISPGEMGREIFNFKYRSRHFVPAERYEKVMFVDCDCLFLKNPDELFAGDAEIMFAEEPWHTITERYFNAYLSDSEMQTLVAPGINAGLWWIAGSQFQDVLAEWERIDSQPYVRGGGYPDQQSWVRLLLDTKLRAMPFRSGVDVRYPFAESRTAPAFAEASLLHYLAASRTKKVSYMFGDYMRHFHAETAPALLHFIDG